MKEIRDIKIDLLMGNQNPLVDLFNEITKDLRIINCNEEGLEFIFWCNYTRYWSLFESNFSLKYEEIQAITKYLVEEALKREISKPVTNKHSVGIGVEEALKREVGEPNTANRRMVFEVEDALKKTLDKK